MCYIFKGIRNGYLFATLVASESAARACLRPAEAVTVSGASSELSPSTSTSLWSFDGVDIEVFSLLVDEGPTFDGLRSSLPNLLCIAFEDFGRGSITGE